MHCFVQLLKKETYKLSYQCTRPSRGSVPTLVEHSGVKNSHLVSHFDIIIVKVTLNIPHLTPGDTGSHFIATAQKTPK